MKDPNMAAPRKTTSRKSAPSATTSRTIAAPGSDITLNEPSVMTIVQPTVKDRWLGLTRRNYTAESVKATLEGQDNGHRLYFQQSMFDLMEQSWPRLANNLFDFRTSVARMEWQVQPYCKKGQKPTSSAQEKADFVEQLFFDMRGDPKLMRSGTTDMIFDLMDAYGKGISVAEIDWTRKAGGIYAPLGTRWIRSVYYDYPNLPDMIERLQLSPKGNPNQQPDLVDFPDNKFLIGAFRWRSSNNVGKIALMRALAPWWIYTNFATEWLLQFGQIFGMPIRWAEYNNKTDLPVVSEMLEQMGAVSWAAFPIGTKLTLHETARAASDNPNAFLVNYSDTLCDICVKGQTLTTQVQNSGNRSLGDVHERQLSGRQKHAGYWAGEVLTSQFSGAIIRLNYGDNEEIPVIAPRIDDPQDPKALAERDKTLFMDMKLPVSKEYLYNTHGVPQPDTSDELYEPPMPPDPMVGIGGGPGANGKGKPGKPGAKNGARQKAFAAIDGLVDADVIKAMEKLPDDTVLFYAKEILNANAPRQHYRKGQPGGGRFMSKANLEAMGKVKDIMDKYPSEGRHRGDRHIKAFGMPDNESEFRVYNTKDMADEVDKRARAVKTGTAVKFKGLKTTQSRIDGEKVMAMLQSTADPSGEPVRMMPVVIKRSNKLWLWDGHHRAVRNTMLGKDEMNCRMVDCEDLKA